jgi:hypothetical protein
MPHQILVAGERHTLDDILQIARDGAVLRFHTSSNGDAVFMSASDLMRDGVPVIGSFGTVAWGQGARLRAGRLSVEVVWRAASQRHGVGEDARCAVCFGALVAGDLAVACVCAALAHEDCARARFNCSRCGAANEEPER